MSARTAYLRSTEENEMQYGKCLVHGVLNQGALLLMEFSHEANRQF